MLDGSVDSVEMCKIWRERFNECSRKLELLQRKILYWREYLANTSSSLSVYVKLNWLSEEIEKLMP